MKHCIDCNNATFTDGPVRQSKQWPAIRMVTCKECGLAQLDNWNSDFQQSLYDYYDSWSAEDTGEAYTELNTRRHRETLADFARQTRGRTLLDVGCGTGHFVESAISEGWHGKGIDLASGAVRLAEKRGIPCSLTDFFELTPAKETFDVLVMAEFIEHVPSPGRFLSHAETLLKHGGLLYLTTPNLDSLTRRLAGEHWPVFHPEHLSYFCPRTLKTLLSSHSPSLRTESFETRNFSIAPVASRAKSVLGQFSAQPGKPSGRAPVERSAGETRSSPTVDQSVRSAVNSLKLLSRAKEAVNSALTFCGAGDTLIVTLKKA